MASGVMQIKYGDERIASKASKACNELEDICSSLSKVRKKLNGLPERSRSGDNLSRASSFLKKKQQQYEKRQDALETLQKKSNTFMSKVETTEKKLSSQIKKEYKQFHKQTGIGKTRGAVILEGLKKAGAFGLKMLTYMIPGYGTIKLAKDLWTAGVKVVDAIKTWYNNLPDGWKYALKIVGATIAMVAVVAAAVAAVIAIGPALAAVGAAGGAVATAIAAVKAGATILAAGGAIISALDGLVKWGKALDVGGTYLAGDKHRASELDSQSAAEYLEGKIGFSSKAYEAIKTFGAVIGVLGGVVSVGASALENMKNFTGANSVIKYLKSFGTETIKKFTGISNMQGFKKYGLKVFTVNINTDADYIKGLKAIKTIYDWGSLKKITDFGAKVIGADSFGKMLFNLVDYVF